MEHQKELLDVLGRYKEKKTGELLAIRLILEKIAKEFPERFAISPPDEDRLSVKEHLNLISRALVGRNPEITFINCKPAIMAGKGAK